MLLTTVCFQARLSSSSVRRFIASACAASRSGASDRNWATATRTRSETVSQRVDGLLRNVWPPLAARPWHRRTSPLDPGPRPPLRGVVTVTTPLTPFEEVMNMEKIVDNSASGRIDIYSNGMNGSAASRIGAPSAKRWPGPSATQRCGDSDLRRNRALSS